MELGKTLLLGLIAGVTIVIGMPVGRMRRLTAGARVFLNAIAIGILLFLVWDVFSHAWEPIDSALGAVHDGGGSLGPVFGYGALFTLGLSVGLLGLVAYDRYLSRSSAHAGRGGPGAMSLEERPARGVATWSPGRRLALLIAVGIGLHNFGEGLAIGQSAAEGAVGLATVLVIGFALHNATEGFGIVAPLAADANDGQRPSWAFLMTMALIGGGPTFAGTWIGHSFTSEAVGVLFLTLAAGSIIYVVCQLLGIATRAKRPDLLSYGLLLGLLAGFATDAVVTAGGA